MRSMLVSVSFAETYATYILQLLKKLPHTFSGSESTQLFSMDFSVLQSIETMQKNQVTDLQCYHIILYHLSNISEGFFFFHVWGLKRIFLVGNCLDR